MTGFTARYAFPPCGRTQRRFLEHAELLNIRWLHAVHGVRVYKGCLYWSAVHLAIVFRHNIIIIIITIDSTKRGRGVHVHGVVRPGHDNVIVMALAY